MMNLKLSLAINASQFKVSDEKIRKLKINLKKSLIEHRFIPQDTYHINLLNLGEGDSDKINELDIKIKKVIEAHLPFELKLNGLWAYPNINEARLLWIGVQNSIELRSLQEDLAQQLIDKNVYREDKIYKPILPIVRLKNYKNVSDMISPYNGVGFGKLSVDQLILYNMISGGAFPVFKLVKTYSLSSEQKKDQPITG